jgi:hypothetical protein
MDMEPGCGRRSMNAFRSYRAYRSNSWQDPEGRTSEQRVALGQPMLDSALERRLVTGSVEMSCLHSVVI